MVHFEDLARGLFELPRGFFMIGLQLRNESLAVEMWASLVHL